MLAFLLNCHSRAGGNPGIKISLNSRMDSRLRGNDRGGELSDCQNFMRG